MRRSKARPGEPVMLRGLPQVQRLLETPEAQALLLEHARPALLRAIRGGLDSVRKAWRDEGAAEPFCAQRFFCMVRERLERSRAAGLRRAVNATGIVVHTNLGRAPLAAEAVRAMEEVGTGYANLELDLETGRRGARDGAVEALLRELTGAEAALVVNNNAAAVLLALAGLAAGGEVVVSRGELVEIGGSFRVPEVIEQGGARLVEVGTTNRTRALDYERAITASSRALLKVHPSNYRIVGFTEAPSRAELAAIGRQHGIPVVEDLGSGTPVDLRGLGLAGEPSAAESLAAGIDLVTFSGDKLLGGPQAGIIAGRADLVARLRSHPLMRALRLDKLRLAALEATLRLHHDGQAGRVPVIAMLARTGEELRQQAELLRDRLAGLEGLLVEVREDVAYAGGGALPGEAIPSWTLTLQAAGATIDELALRLRRGEPPVVARIAGGRLVLDLRTLLPGDLEDLVRVVREAVACAR